MGILVSMWKSKPWCCYGLKKNESLRTSNGSFSATSANFLTSNGSFRRIFRALSNEIDHKVPSVPDFTEISSRNLRFVSTSPSRRRTVDVALWRRKRGKKQRDMEISRKWEIEKSRSGKSRIIRENSKIVRFVGEIPEKSRKVNREYFQLVYKQS